MAAWEVGVAAWEVGGAAANDIHKVLTIGYWWSGDCVIALHVTMDQGGVIVRWHMTLRKMYL